MKYFCSACHKEIGRIVNREGLMVGKEGNPVKFYCPNTGRMATAQ